MANRARTTVSKSEINHEPSDEFINKILMAEHSPIRSRVYGIKIKNMKSWVATHFVRHHIGVEKWVSTQRTDRTGVNRDILPQGELVTMELEANAQALINISRKRLCNQASKETREIMQEIKNKIQEQDPHIARVMQRECIYRGFCPEMWSCRV